MKKTTATEIMARLFELLNNINEPMPVASLIQLELTGDPATDKLLSSISMISLEKLKSDGIINSDDLMAPNANIYGFTPQGCEMYELFLKYTSEK